MKINTTPNINNFAITKVYSPNRLTLRINAYAKDFLNMPYNGNYPEIAHYDLFNLLNSLKNTYINYFGFVGINPNNVRILGVTIVRKSDEENPTGVIIKGTVKSCVLNTKQIGYKDENYGRVLTEITEKIRVEIYKYLFEDKKTSFTK